MKENTSYKHKRRCAAYINETATHQHKKRHLEVNVCGFFLIK